MKIVEVITFPVAKKVQKELKQNTATADKYYIH